MNAGTLPRLARWNPATMRHAWVKECDHHYDCRHCGIHKENMVLVDASPTYGARESKHRGWYQRWLTRDGVMGDTRGKVDFPKCPGPPDSVRVD